MASRAFFRCRACGEPVVSKAYRCPVCGIDFPTGTHNAPTTPDSPAAVSPTKDARSRPAHGHDIASRLEGALGEELREPEPPDPRDEFKGEVWTDVGAGRRARSADKPNPADPAPYGLEREVADDPFDAAHDDEDADDAETDREDEAGGLDVAAIVPGQARSSAREKGPGLSVSPGRAKRVVVAEPRQPREILVVERRSVVKGLGGTIVVAILALGAIGGTAVYMERTGLAHFGLFDDQGSGLADGDSMTVGAADGWVNIPVAPGAVVIDADGTFRVRLDGQVFTGTADQRLRIPISEGTTLSVRTVREPTQATISRAD